MLKDVIQTLEKREFTDPGDDISDGNTIIGVMSPLERAIYTVLERSSLKFKSLGECPHGTVNFGCLSTFMFEMEFCPFVKELTAIKGEVSYNKELRDLMFALIESRLYIRNREIDNVNLNSKFRITTSTKIEIPETIELFEGWEKMDVNAMLEISLKSTILEPVLEIIQTAKFDDVDDPVASNEEFIREMNVFEKGLWTLYSKLHDELKAKSEEKDNLLDGPAFKKSSSTTIIGLGMMMGVGMSATKESYSFKDPKHADVIRVKKLSEEISTIETRIDPLKKLFWKVVASGIPQEKLDKYDSKGIRQGFKIVVYNDDED
ncbi:hypothetical protein K9M48_03920 [Candidatus Gracilibacteria bacterium]|nr:hypothetical protein [Candidatus Gracilibacteria bacterium]